MEEKENQIKVLKRITESDGSHSWLTVDLDTFQPDPNRPILLVFGGNSTNGDHPTKGNANIVSSLVGVFNEDVELLSIDYNGSSCFGEDLMPLVNSIFLPQVCKDGHKLPVEEAIKNLRKITIFAHCFGAIIPLEEIAWKLSFIISNLGYNGEEQDEMMKQMVSVSFATKRPTSFMSGLDVLSLTDDTFDKERQELARKFLKELTNVKLNPLDIKFLKAQSSEYSIPLKVIDFIAENDRCYILPHENGNRLALIAANFSMQGDHSINPIRLTPMWKAYPNTTPTGFAVSKCVAAVLCNSIANSILNLSSDKFAPFNIEYLKKQLEDIVQNLNETNANYSL